MKRVILIVFILWARMLFSYSQDNIFVLHTAVGDTIDKKEKMDFDLFPEFKSTEFRYGIIYSSTEMMNLNVYVQNDSIIVKQLKSLDILKYQSNINKLLAFYSIKNNKDSISELNKEIDLYGLIDNNNIVNVNINIDKKVIRKSAYEGRRKKRLLNNALLNGLTGKEATDAATYQGYGEIRLKK